MASLHKSDMSTDKQTESVAAPSTFVLENFHKTQLDGFIAMGANLRNLFPDDSEKILGGLCVFFFIFKMFHV